MVKSKEAWINTKLKEIQKKCKQSEAKDIIDRKYIPYEYQADERAGVAGLSCRVSGR